MSPTTHPARHPTSRPNTTPLPLPLSSLSPFFTLPDGQLSPLDRIMLSARSLSASSASPSAPHSALSSPLARTPGGFTPLASGSGSGKTPFLSPLSMTPSIHSPLPIPHTPLSSIHDSQPPASPHSPLLHTRFGTPSRSPHSPHSPHSPDSPVGSMYSQLTGHSSPLLSPSPEPGSARDHPQRLERREAQQGNEKGLGVMIESQVEEGEWGDGWTPRTASSAMSVEGSGSAALGGLLDSLERAAAAVPARHPTDTQSTAPAAKLDTRQARTAEEEEDESEVQEASTPSPSHPKRPLIGPVPQKARKQSRDFRPSAFASPATSDGASSSAAKLSPVLPGYEGSYFPPPERYRPARSPAAVVVVTPGKGGQTPGDVSLGHTHSRSRSEGSTPGYMLSPAEDVFGLSAIDSFSPPRVVVDSPDEPPRPAMAQTPRTPATPATPATPGTASSAASGLEFQFVITAEPEELPAALSSTPSTAAYAASSTPAAGKAKSYTSGNFSRPRIAVSPVAAVGFAAGQVANEARPSPHRQQQRHATDPNSDRPRTSGQDARTPPSSFTYREREQLRRSNSQPSVSPTRAQPSPAATPAAGVGTASPLQLRIAFLDPMGAGTPPELSASTSWSADTSLDFTSPATPGRSPQLGSLAPLINSGSKPSSAQASPNLHGAQLAAPSVLVNRQLAAVASTTTSRGSSSSALPKAAVGAGDAGGSPHVSVYSDYSYYSVGSSSDSQDGKGGPNAGQPRLHPGTETRDRPAQAAASASTVTSTGTVKPPRPPPPTVPIGRGRAAARPAGTSKVSAPAASRALSPPGAVPPRLSTDSRRTPSLSSISSLSDHPAPSAPTPASAPQTVPRLPQPVQHLHSGIAAHEAGNLPLAAEHFELAAKLAGGCPLGMVMWGLTLRHGWGMRKDEARGFVWLRKGVERSLKEWEAVSASGGGKGKGAQRAREELGSVRQELVYALREVARGLMHGWGVKEDKKMGFNYFLVAAQLGDPESAQEVAFCYEKGKGVKKDKHEAARWYRKAVRGGVSDVGLAWIWKPKYD